MLGSTFPLCNLNVSRAIWHTFDRLYSIHSRSMEHICSLSHSSSLCPLLDISNQISFGSFHSHRNNDIVPFGLTTPHSVQLCQWALSSQPNVYAWQQLLGSLLDVKQVTGGGGGCWNEYFSFPSRKDTLLRQDVEIRCHVCDFPLMVIDLSHICPFLMQSSLQ